MKTKEEAEARALELFPDISDEDVAIESVLNHISSLKRQAYLKGWEESQDTKPRKAAERVVEYWKMNPSLFSMFG